VKKRFQKVCLSQVHNLRRYAAAEQRAEGTALKLKDAGARLQARDAEIRELGHQSVVLREGGAQSASQAEESMRKLSQQNAVCARVANELTVGLCTLNQVDP
jgi:hypothetical protein